MSDATAEHAAEVTADVLCDLSTMGCDEHRNANGDDCLSLLWYHELGDHIAAALAAAGLLCAPPERAVIDAAIAETAAEVACNALTRSVTAREFEWWIGVRDAAREARRVAVAEHKAAT